MPSQGFSKKETSSAIWVVCPGHTQGPTWVLASGSTYLTTPVVPPGGWDQLFLISSFAPKSLRNLHRKGPSQFPGELPGEWIASDGQPRIFIYFLWGHVSLDQQNSAETPMWRWLELLIQTEKNICPGPQPWGQRGPRRIFAVAVYKWFSLTHVLKTSCHFSWLETQNYAKQKIRINYTAI